MKEDGAGGVLWHSRSSCYRKKIHRLIFLAAVFGLQTAVVSVGTRGPRKSAFEACLERGEAVCTRTIPKRGRGADAISTLQRIELVPAQPGVDVAYAVGGAAVETAKHGKRRSTTHKRVVPAWVALGCAGIDARDAPWPRPPASCRQTLTRLSREQRAGACCMRAAGGGTFECTAIMGVFACADAETQRVWLTPSAVIGLTTKGTSTGEDVGQQQQQQQQEQEEEEEPEQEQPEQGQEPVAPAARERRAQRIAAALSDMATLFPKQGVQRESERQHNREFFCPVLEARWPADEQLAGMGRMLAQCKQAALADACSKRYADFAAVVVEQHISKVTLLKLRETMMPHADTCLCTKGIVEPYQSRGALTDVARRTAALRQGVQRHAAFDAGARASCVDPAYAVAALLGGKRNRERLLASSPSRHVLLYSPAAAPDAPAAPGDGAAGSEGAEDDAAATAGSAAASAAAAAAGAAAAAAKAAQIAGWHDGSAAADAAAAGAERTKVAFAGLAPGVACAGIRYGYVRGAAYRGVVELPQGCDAPQDLPEDWSVAALHVNDAQHNIDAWPTALKAGFGYATFPVMTTYAINPWLKVSKLSFCPTPCVVPNIQHPACSSPQGPWPVAIGCLPSVPLGWQRPLCGHARDRQGARHVPHGCARVRQPRCDGRARRR